MLYALLVFDLFKELKSLSILRDRLLPFAQGLEGVSGSHVTDALARLELRVLVEV